MARSAESEPRHEVSPSHVGNARTKAGGPSKADIAPTHSLSKREASEEHATEGLLVGRDHELRVAARVEVAQLRLVAPEDEPVDLRVLGELEANGERRRGQPVEAPDRVDVLAETYARNRSTMAAVSSGCSSWGRSPACSIVSRSR